MVMPAPVISIAQMREWENASWAKGRRAEDVIRRVGRAVVETALHLTRPTDLILVLAGRGNNGADARATLELFDDRRLDTMDVKDPVADLEELETLLAIRPALIIDGLFGIGLNRPLDAAWQKFIGAINASKIPVLSVDVPSGLNADTGEPFGAAIQAAITLTVGAPKTGMLQQNAWPFVGRLEVAREVGLIDAGQVFGTPGNSSRQTCWTSPEDFAGFPPARPVAGHKGTFGHVGIIAGSAGYHGAAVLATRAAQRAQPGLVTLLTQEQVYFPVAAQLQAAMVRAWKPQTALPDKFSALLIGPGLASPDLPEELKQLTRHLWKTSPNPLVVDAIALDWLTPETFPPGAIRVLTPHPGEAGRLLNLTTATVQADRAAALRALSKKFGGCLVVLKGHQTLVGRDVGEIFVNASGNPHLAQGGAGDLLSGLITGLLAQPPLQTDALLTVRYGVWRHGAAADRLQTLQPNWVIEDLAATC
jgi:NAD(P)H-hydrate epimerase